MKMRGSALGVLIVLAAIPSAGAVTAFADGDGVSYVNPHATATGDVVVLERRVVQTDPGQPCATVTHRDVSVYRARRGCGSESILRITRDGLSSDGSISADGAAIAWRRTEIDGTNRIFVADPDGSGALEIYACAGAVSDLEISPDADEVFFKVHGRTVPAQAEIIRVRIAQPGVALVIDVAPAADDLGLNRRRCVNSAGTLAYSKSAGGQHDLFRWSPTGGIQYLLTPGATSTDERLVSIGDSAGPAHVVFRRTTLAGVQELYQAGVSGANLLVTSNAETAWKFRDVVISQDAGWAVFESNGDFAGANSDGSDEVYRVVVTWPAVAPSQVSDASPLPPFFGPPWQEVDGVDISNTGEAVIWSSVVMEEVIACAGGSWNELAARISSDRVVSLQVSTWGFEIIPSHDLILDPVQDSATGCFFAPGTVTCTARVLVSAEGPRRLLVHPRWAEGTCIPSVAEGPGEIVLEAGQVGLVSFTTALPGCHVPGQGTFELDVVAPELSQNDATMVSRAF